MNIRSYAAAAALWTLAAVAVHADALHGSGCCGCNSGCQVQKVCRVECEMKDVKTTKYKVECEDFCVPCRSEKCGCKEIPVCGQVRTKKKLVKYEEVKKVPHYKCVVKYLCPTCCHHMGYAALPASAPNLADGDDAPAELIPTLAETIEPAAGPSLNATAASDVPGLNAPAVRPVSARTMR